MFVEKIKDLFEDRKLSYFYGKIPFFSKKLQKFINMKECAIDKKQWTSQEEQLLFKLHLQYGNKWSIISTHIPGDKQDNHVKNKFYSTLRKGFRKMNKYITNVRRKIYSSEIAVNKLLKPEFLTKLTAVADRNFLQKFEVKQKAIDLSQTIQKKLIELSKNTDDYQRIDSRKFTFQQLLLAQIHQFNRNCKKRKGKRKTKAQNKHNELLQSQSVSEAQMIEQNSQNSQMGAKQKKQEQQQMQIKKQKEQEEQMQENIIIRLLPEVAKQTQDKNYLYPFQDQLNFKNQSNNDYIRTPHSMISTHRSLKNFMNSSPLINNGSNFQQALLAFPFKMQTSLLLSKTSQLSMNFKSPICKQKTNINFLQDIPMAKKSSNALLFTSAQIGRISEYDNQQRSEFSRKLSTSEGYDPQRSLSNVRKSQVEVSKFYQSKMINNVSSIDEQKQDLQRQFQSEQKMQK